MNSTNLAIIVAVVVVAAAVGIWLALRARRTRKLHSRFGTEYERTVGEIGSRSKAEHALLEREQRVKALPLRDLDPAERQGFVDHWSRLQAEFVDDPQASIVHADVLVGDVMKARGYPVADFEQRAADISVDHPIVVDNYRRAHAIAMRRNEGAGSTEDLRQAMVHYRTLFEDLTRAPQESGGSAPAAESP